MVDFKVRKNGTLSKLTFENEEIPFRNDCYSGFKFYTIIDKKVSFVELEPNGSNIFYGESGYQAYLLSYFSQGNTLIVKAQVTNNDDIAFIPTTLGLKTGIDCCMDKYPDWNDKYFPTLMRCEKTHFWGYNMTPDGNVLVFGCEDAVAAWSNDYNKLTDKYSVTHYLTGGHRIYTWNLHLINRPPLPKRHPILDRIEPGETKVWTIKIKLIKNELDVTKEIASLCNSSAITFDRYTIAPGELSNATVFSNDPNFTVSLVNPDGCKAPVSVVDSTFSFQAPNGAGVYEFKVENSKGKESSALVYVREKYSWYLDKARDAVVKAPPVYTHHLECFNSLYTILLARKFLPDNQKDAFLENSFIYMLENLYNNEKNTVNEAPWRIQDSASLSYIMALRYTLTKNEADLEKACHLSDYILSVQGEDGAYYSMPPWGGKTHYTAVAYIAKYVLETAQIEMSSNIARYKVKGKKHFESAKKAILNLKKLKENIETEGEMTFEDGMISCSMLMLALYSLTTSDDIESKECLDVAEEMFLSHRCLTQSVLPDCRQNGATLRFWEAQYNLSVFNNMMNSPSGWTAWKLYGDYYLYLLTGKERYLNECMNGLGACMQLIDIKTGELRWGFISDPYIETLRYVQAEPNTNKGKLIDDIIGEEYLEMSSTWHRVEKFPRPKWGIDNLVHEVFKCITEIALTNAFVLENECGELVGYNCDAFKENGIITVNPKENFVEKIHFNLKSKKSVKVNFGNDTVLDTAYLGFVRRK